MCPHYVHADVPSGYFLFWMFYYTLNPSVWSDKYCSSCCTLSLIRLHLDNIGRKCNRASLYMFTKVLALLWCGRQFLQIIASFFSLLEVWVFFLPSLIYASLERGNEIWNECYCYRHIAEACSFEMVYDITLIYQLFVSSWLIWCLGFVRSCSLLQWWLQVESVCWRMRWNKVC